jgi:hypothetical protein
VRPRFTARNFYRPPAFATFSWPQWEQWSGSLADLVIEAIQAGGRAVSGVLRSSRWHIPIDTLGPKSDGRSIGFHQIRFGNELCMLGMSAEVVNGYTEIVDRLTNMDTIPVGCIDSISGYLPTDVIVQQGGYEAERSMRVYGLTGKFLPNVSDVIYSALKSGMPDWG